MHFLLSRARSVNFQEVEHDKQLQDLVEEWVSFFGAENGTCDRCSDLQYVSLSSPSQLHKACASSSHLILEFPPKISLDPVPVQSCIAKMKTAQGGDQDAVIALMELFLCDIRKLSTDDMNKVWEVGPSIQ
jgi:hypothetical protein